MKRKFFRIMLSFILAVSMLSAPQMAVFAEDEGEAAQTQQAEEQNAQPQVIPNDASDQTNSTDEEKPDEAIEEEKGQPKDETANDSKDVKPAKKFGASIKSMDGAVGIGDVKYETLSEAIKEAKDGDVLKLYSDLTEFNEVSGKKITIDLNDNTITAKGGSDKYTFKINADAEVTIKNGSIKGGYGKHGGNGVIGNDGKLSLDEMDFTGNTGEVIKNTGTLNIDDSSFEDNSVTQSLGGQTYIINNRGVDAKVTVKDTAFEDNERPYGGIIYGWGSSYVSKSKNEITLTSCDITGNVVGWYGCIAATYNTKLTLNDTTVKENTGGLSNTETAGLYVTSCQIHWNESAIYNNDIGEGNSFADDIFVLDSEDITAGEIPLAKDMSDHGKKLEGYVLKNRRNDIIAENPINKNKRVNQEWTVCQLDQNEGLAEYRGDEYPSIAKAVDAIDEYDSEPLITILKDAEVSEIIPGVPGLEIDLDGHTLSGKEKGGTILSIKGDGATVKNGTISGCNEKNNQKSALYADRCKITLENLNFENNKGTAVRLYDPVGTAKVKGCSFKGNGLSDLEYCQALEVIGSDADISDCTFEGNGRSLRIAESVNKINVSVEGCNIKDSKAKAITILSPEGSNTVFKDCVITGTKTGEASDSAIHMDAAGFGANINGGAATFENCNIEDNESSKYTLLMEAGELTLDGCTIKGNTAETSGAVYAEIFSSVKAKDTVIKENAATGSSRGTSGGISLESSNLMVGEYNYDTGRYEYKAAGFRAASFEMEGGALYGNSTEKSSPTADDLYVGKKCNISLFDPQEFKDGSVNFADMEWKEDGSKKSETVPAKESDSYRYYAVKKDEVLNKVYIDGEKGDDEGDGTEERPVKTLGRAMELAEDNDCKTLIVSGTITIAKKRAKGFMSLNPETTGVLDTDGMVIKRDTDFDGHLISLAAGSELTIKNTIIDGNARTWVKALSSLIKVNEGASLTLDDGAVLRYNGYHGSKTLSEKGGAIYSKNGEITILPGSTIKSNYAVKGGGILADGGTINMSGGTIEDNTALWKNDSAGKLFYNDSYGGGIAMRYGAQMNLSGGNIINNTALKDGGGISLGDYYTSSVTQGGTVTLNMTGGTIDGNKAYSAGGGIMVQCNTVATISGGDITNNEAGAETCYHAGGGIYVNGIHNETGSLYGAKHGTLYLTNVELTQNTAKWEGGAIAWCGAGTGGISDIKGTVIYENTSEGKAPNDWTTPYHGDYEVIYDNVLWPYNYDEGKWETVRLLDELISPTYTSEYMLNGGPYNWVDENGDPVDTDSLHKNTKVFRLNNSLSADDPDVKESSAMAKVRINGNRSESNGGGIGANGNVYIGETPDYVDIPVEKKWDDEGREDERFSKIKMDLYRDGKLVKSIILSAENDWKGAFKEQPKYRVDKDGKQTKDPYEYTVKEDMKYKPRGGMAVEDCYKCKEELADGTWVITNTPNDYYLPVTPPLKAVKTLDGENPGDKQFTFELYNAEGVLIDSVKNNGEEIEFTPMEFDTPGEYVFTIKEKVELEPGMIYDITEYTAVIEVIEDNGELKSHVTYKLGDEKLENGELPIFSNATIDDEDSFYTPDDGPSVPDKVEGAYEDMDIHKTKKKTKAYSAATGDEGPVQTAMAIGLSAMIIALGAIFFRKRRLS